ncbi:MAG: oligosaccharide flippase family protein, partial [Gemmatimonadetes bacterium]|nr:oligosaccharide flippase family protein [Gemmatimonadota bacterium]
GLVALSFIVIHFAEMVVDFGLGPAVVQHRELSQRHVRVAFTASTLLGVLVALGLAAAAPLFAGLLGNEGVPDILRWQALIFVASGSAATARGVLERRLDYRALFWVAFSSYGVGYVLLAVTLALLGFGVWSLVFGALAQSVVAAAVTLVFARHPMRPLFAGKELRELTNFGLGVTLNRLVIYASLQGDNFVVGRWLGPAALGLYSRAFQLMNFPLYQLSFVTWNVLFSAYSRLQGEPARARRAYLKGIQLTSLVTAPITAGMVVAGPHAIVGLYGPQWVHATVPFQVLCSVGLLRSVYSATGALANAFGRVYAEFQRQILYAVLVIGAAVLGSNWGITGVAIGVAGAVVAMYFAMAQLGVSLSGCGWGDFFHAQLPGLLLAVWVAAAAALVRFTLEPTGLGSGTILFAIVMASLAVLPVGVYLLPNRLRPMGLFRTVEPMVARLPATMQTLARRVLRLPEDQAGGGAPQTPPESRPLVSVVTPCFNAEPFVREAIESVLAQTYPRVEMIVLDDGSTDGSWEVIRSFGSSVTALQQAKAGPARARNLGVAHARGDYVLFLDADDVIAPDTIEALVSTLEGNAHDGNAIAACRWRRLVHRRGAWVPASPGVPFPPSGPEPLVAWLRGEWVALPSLLWPRRLFERLGGFDPELTADEDGDLVLRAFVDDVRLVVSPGGESFYRQHGSQRITVSHDLYPEHRVRSRMRVLEKLEKELRRQGKWEEYRVPLGIAYQVLAQLLFVTRPELAREALQRGEAYAGRRAIAPTWLGRVLVRLTGMERKERIAGTLARWGFRTRGRGEALARLQTYGGERPPVQDEPGRSTGVR